MGVDLQDYRIYRTPEWVWKSQESGPVTTGDSPLTAEIREEFHGLCHRLKGICG